MAQDVPKQGILMGFFPGILEDRGEDPSTLTDEKAIQIATDLPDSEWLQTKPSRVATTRWRTVVQSAKTKLLPNWNEKTLVLFAQKFAEGEIKLDGDFASVLLRGPSFFARTKKKIELHPAMTAKSTFCTPTKNALYDEESYEKTTTRPSHLSRRSRFGRRW